MVLALAVAIGSVALGAALGLYRKSGPLLGAVRTFALVAAMVVVLVQLLPDALAEIGLWALVVAAGAAMLPGVLGRLLGGSGDGDGNGNGNGDGDGNGNGNGHGAAAVSLAHDHSVGHRVGLEVGYLGLLLHKVGDGAGLATFSTELHEGHGHYDVFAAIAAHSIPITALVVLAFARDLGARAGLVRAAGLAAAATLGIAAVQVLPLELLEVAHPWVSSVVGGLLLHVVAHDWSPGETRNRRPLGELIAVALGLSLVILPGAHGHAHGEGAISMRDAAGHAFVDLTLDTAPTLLLGLLIGAALQLFGSRIPIGWLTRGSNLRQAIRGAVVGAPLPICACGVLPVAQSLRNRGAGAALVVAFLLATPELGIETFALTVRFLGWEMAFARLFSAVGVAIAAALLVARFATKTSESKRDDGAKDAAINDSGAPGPWPQRLLESLDELLGHIGPWTLIGLVTAAYVQAALTADSLTGFTAFGLDVLVVSLVAVPSYVCAASATPLAAVLIAKGLSPGAVLAGLLLGPATNMATVAFLRSHFGGRATAVGLATLIGTVWLIAMGLNASPITITPMTEGAHDHGPDWLAWGATAILSLLSLRAILRKGLASWLGAIREGPGDAGETGEDEHGHGHGHG
ncbi:MAG: permease [Deltaproteobacteria bacterium]|nr:permease [Deltaproteobacteria bacterium]